MKLVFSKMEGLGNDFVMLDDRGGIISGTYNLPELSQKLCDRHFGIGADGIILLGIPDNPENDFKYTIVNSDGSYAEMCGNGMRCFAKYIYENGFSDKKILKIETMAGLIVPEIALIENGFVKTVKVNMGKPQLHTKKIPFISEQRRAVGEPFEIEGFSMPITTVSMGNPHSVFFVDDLNEIKLKEIGPVIETDKRFPEKTNVEFVQVISKHELSMKVWERGAGITLACGTGACAVLVAAFLNKKTERAATIHLPGGDLIVEWDSDDGCVYKTGPANLVFKSEIEV